jgi:sec-independent protein translocase protein TatA
MAFGDPIQWVVIAVVVLALLLWGPSKIPQLAKGLGQARNEFSKAQKEGENQSQEAAKANPAPQASVDDVLLRTARELGIITEGKTREQIASEIVARATPKA